MPARGTLRETSSIGRTIQKRMTQAHVWLYRRTKGRVGGRMLGCEVLLLHTTGRRSGLERTTPLMYTSDGDDIVLVASNGGSRLHPTWYLNLSADPSVRVERKGPAEAWTARTATREEKERLWPGIVDAYKGYAAYERRTDRDIPLVILEKG